MARPYVARHVARGVAMAFGRGGMVSVAVLVQAALCAPIEGAIVENEEKLSIISMERSGTARILRGTTALARKQL